MQVLAPDSVSAEVHVSTSRAGPSVVASDRRSRRRRNRLPHRPAAGECCGPAPQQAMAIESGATRRSRGQSEVCPLSMTCFRNCPAPRSALLAARAPEATRTSRMSGLYTTDEESSNRAAVPPPDPSARDGSRPAAGDRDSTMTRPGCDRAGRSPGTAAPRPARTPARHLGTPLSAVALSPVAGRADLHRILAPSTVELPIVLSHRPTLWRLAASAVPAYCK